MTVLEDSQKGYWKTINAFSCLKVKMSQENNSRRISKETSDEHPNEKPNEGPSECGSFEDILEIIGTFGPWNIMVFSLCYGASILSALQLLTYEFVGATPDHWCRVDQLIEANWTQKQILDFAIPSSNLSKHEKCQMYDYNYTLAVELGYEEAKDIMTTGEDTEPGIISCLSRDFNRTEYQSTLVTEFDLVCERRPLYSTTQAIAMLGVLLGDSAVGLLTNIFGRRKTIVGFVFLYILSGSLSCAAPTFEVYIIFKLLACFCISIIYNGCFINMIELCSSSQRSSVGPLFLLPWALGYMLVPGLAYFIRPWRWLNAAYTIPGLFHCSYYWLMPESPRWLISKGRYQEALEVFTWAAKVNRRDLPKPEELIAIMKTIPISRDERTEDKMSKTLYKGLKDIFILVTSPEFRSKVIVIAFLWFAVSLVYYGISLGSSNLSANTYIFMLIGGIIEVVSYILLWPSMAYLGRRFSLISQFIFCGIVISITGALLASVEGVPTGVLMTLFLSGKLAITATFHLLYIYTSELFPTKYRSLAVGQGSFMARIASMISPYIIDLLGGVVKWSPSVLFGGISVLAAIASMRLPETNGATMNETKSITNKDSGRAKEMSDICSNEDREAK